MYIPLWKLWLQFAQAWHVVWLARRHHLGACRSLLQVRDPVTGPCCALRQDAVRQDLLVLRLAGRSQGACYPCDPQSWHCWGYWLFADCPLLSGNTCRELQP